MQQIGLVYEMHHIAHGVLRLATDFPLPKNQPTNANEKRTPQIVQSFDHHMKRQKSVALNKDLMFQVGQTAGGSMVCQSESTCVLG